MRIIITLLLCIACMPFNSVAQQKRLQLGVTGGLSSTYISGDAVTQGDAIYGFQGTLKAVFDFRPVQFGAGVEVGNIATNIVVPRFSATKGLYPASYNGDIAGFYKAPHALLNFKINVTDNLYFCIGGLGGVMMANSDVIEKNFTTLLYGANAGLVINFGSTIGIEIFEGWRHTKIEDVYRFEVPNGSQPIVYEIDMSHTLNYFTTNIGLRIRFGRERAWYR